MIVIVAIIPRLTISRVRVCHSLLNYHDFCWILFEIERRLQHVLACNCWTSYEQIGAFKKLIAVCA